MADEKKKDGGGGELFHDKHYQEVLFFVLPGLLALSYLINRLLRYFNGIETSPLLNKITAWFESFWSFWRFSSTILTGGAIALWIYSFIRLREIEHEEEKIYGVKPVDDFLIEDEEKKRKMDKWQQILTHVHSENQAEWRVAIMEADIMLEEALSTLGYQGEGVGEKLKSVGEGELISLDVAWEAHKVRNRIAHSGTDFDLTQREAKRIISLYEIVFREVGAI